MKRKRKVLQIGLIALALASLLMAGLPSPARAQGNSTTIGTLSLAPAFESISVYSNFSGDDNGDNLAILKYREVGSTEWKQVTPFTVDRREQVSYYNGDLHQTLYKDNDFKYQWRGIIFWLTPNTEYEVRVTYTDPDGVIGTNPVSGTVTTRNDNPPSNGNTYYVSTSGGDGNDGSYEYPWKTIQHAVDNLSAGDKVLIMPGIYYEEVIFDAKSGVEDNYITLQSYDLNNKAVIDGQSSLMHNIVIANSSYIRIRGMDLRYPAKPGDGRNILIDRDCHGIIIEDNIITEPGDQWACSGVLIRYGDPWESPIPCTDGLIQRNTITCNDERSQRFGVFFWGEGQSGFVIRNNTIVGKGFKDGIGGNSYKDIFIHDNYIQDPWDDALEIEGDNVNVAIWNNLYKNTWSGSMGYMGLGMAPVTIGPYYVFRNVFVDFRDAGLKMGNSSEGVCYIYHNTLYTSSHTNGVGHFGNNAKLNNVISRNNIIQVGRYVIENVDTDPDWSRCDYDYDNLFTRSTTRFAKWQTDTLDSPTTFEEFRALTGFEAHGISADSKFVNSDAHDFRLQAGSPCIDKGVVLPGFNDENSPWPYQGSAPDIGAYEFGSGPPPPPGPLHHITVIPASVSLEVGQTQQFTAIGYDQNDNYVPITPSWSTNVGSIDGNGLFTAGTVAGTYPNVVKAEAGSVTGYASVTVTAPQEPGGDGGDGGGDGGDSEPTPKLKLEMMGKVFSVPMTKEGVLEEALEASSPDGAVTLRFAEGTQMLDSEGNRLEEITVYPASNPPGPPGGVHIVGLAYDLGPEGATFDPEVELIIRYYPGLLSDGVSEEHLVMAYYNSDSEQWVLLPSVIDTEAHTVSVWISHFTIFAIVGREEAAFHFANLSISPTTVDRGESVDITVEVTNTGGLEGSCSITLLIDDVEEATQELTLAPGAIDAITFTVTRDAEGSYSVDIEGLTGEFTVTAPSFPWVLFGGVLGGVLAALAVGIALYLVVLRPRGSDPQRIDYLRRKVRDAIVRVLNRRKRL